MNHQGIALETISNERAYFRPLGNANEGPGNLQGLTLETKSFDDDTWTRIAVWTPFADARFETQRQQAATRPAGGRTVVVSPDSLDGTDDFATRFCVSDACDASAPAAAGAGVLAAVVCVS